MRYALFLSLAWIAGCVGAPREPGSWSDQPWCPDECCLDDYRSLPRKAGGEAKHRSRREVMAALEALETTSGEEDRGPLPRAQLRRELVEGLNIGFLLRDVESREPVVAVSAPEPVGELTRRRVRLRDPLVGVLHAELLVPPGDGPHPALIGIHGHCDDARTFSDAFGGQALAERGFVVLMPTMRADDAAACESRASFELLEAGISLMGVRAYEVLAFERYLRTRDDVRPDALGLIGHSGGGVTGAIVVRLTDRFAAFVTDFMTDFRIDRDEGGRIVVTDETSPALHRLREDIAELETLPIPYLALEYGEFGFEQGLGTVASFFTRALGPEPPPVSPPPAPGPPRVETGG